METEKILKAIKVSFTPKEQGEGDGAKVKRFIGVSKLESLDPFLMLDWATVKLPAGFPDHPHRGFETVSYLLEGEMCHEDSKGHKGVLSPGDIQWMTAGKGIVHSEMPLSFTEPANGFQLWINLDKKNKMREPRYQEFKSEEIPVYQDENFSAKVIAGEVFGVKGPIEAITPAYYIDFRIKKDKFYEHLIPQDWNAMIVVHEGSVEVQGKQTVNKGDCAVFQQNTSRDEYISIKGISDNSSFLLLAGKPIGEPIAWRGPFVMNTMEEIKQTIYDYQNGINGFEGAHKWESQIQYLKYKKQSKKE